MDQPADSASLRKTIYALLITLAVGGAAGRILAASLVFDPHSFKDETNPQDTRKPWPKARPAPTPMCSSNDRSRWATVRALVDDGSYVVGKRDRNQASATNRYGDVGIIFEDGWTSVDKVLHPDTLEYYSSKPPLLATLVAGEYWLLKHVLGWTMAETHERVVRFILITINLVPYAFYLLVLSWLVERFGTTDWGRVYVMAAACLGTLVLPFLSTFNNHTPATFAALGALYVVIQIWTNPPSARPTAFALAGLLSGFAMTMELPAAAFVAAAALVLFVRHRKETLLYFVPAAILPVAALLLTNYLAVGRLEPVYSKLKSPWYQYEGSHWEEKPSGQRTGIDFVQEKEPIWMYAVHILVGHHGLFSLTPIFLVAVAGMILGWKQARSEPVADEGTTPAPALPAFVYPLTAFLTVLLLFFYIFMAPRNYGGGTCGPRWLMWLTPFLLLTMLPAADYLAGKRWGRWLAYSFLVVSIISAVYPMQNPWKHPWLYNFMDAQGWLPY